MKKHYLYRVRTNEGQVIYIGITDNLKRRMSGHKNENKWWPIRGTIDFCVFSKRTYCKAYETYLINYYMPEFNQEEKDGHLISNLPFDLNQLEWFLYEENHIDKVVLELKKLTEKNERLEIRKNELKQSIRHLKKENKEFEEQIFIRDELIEKVDKDHVCFKVLAFSMLYLVSKYSIVTAGKVDIPVWFFYSCIGFICIFVFQFFTTENKLGSLFLTLVIFFNLYGAMKLSKHEFKQLERQKITSQNTH